MKRLLPTLIAFLVVGCEPRDHEASRPKITLGPDWDVRNVRESAEAGDANAQYRLGTFYHIGFQLDPSPDQAVRWYRLAADQGNAEAQEAMGRLYVTGVGVSKNLEEALKWFRKAADSGLATAQRELGVMYLGGLGVQKNDDESAKWFRMAENSEIKAASPNFDELFQNAQAGDAEAQWELGRYFNTSGESAVKDAEALRWWLKAANQGHMHAAYYVGHAYRKGYGVAKDQKVVLEWIGKAALLGAVYAQAELGRIYFEGEGVRRDYVEAYAWYSLSLAHEDPLYQFSKKARSQLERKLSNDELIKAKARLTELEAQLESYSGNVRPLGSPRSSR